jgi:hypothetical protein
MQWVYHIASYFDNFLDYPAQDSDRVTNYFSWQSASQTENRYINRLNKYMGTLDGGRAGFNMGIWFVPAQLRIKPGASPI